MVLGRSSVIFAVEGDVKPTIGSMLARMKRIHTAVATVGNAAARAVSWAPGNEETYYCGSRSAWFTAFQGGYNLQQNDTRILDGRTTFFYFAIGNHSRQRGKIGRNGLSVRDSCQGC